MTTMKNANWFFGQCLNCKHLVTKTNMNTGKRTYACDNGTAMVTSYISFRYVNENDVVVPSTGAEEVCESFAERLIVTLNQ